MSEPKGVAGKVKNEFDLEISSKLTTEGTEGTEGTENTENTEKCKIALCTLCSLWFFKSNINIF